MTLIHTAEPFLLPGTSRIGCLLIHGFTGTPKEMRWMGEFLQAQGFSALGPRLFAHATRPEDMFRARYADWMASVEDGFSLLQGLTDEIYLIGLSMGGALALTCAAELPARGVITMSTPASLPGDWRLNHTALLSRFQPFLPKSKEAPGAGWFDPAGWQEHISYPQNPVRAIGELKSLLKEMNTRLPQVKQPALLVHSRNDRYVPQDSMERLYARLGSAQKSMLWVENSGHVIPRDAERQTVFRAAAEFIRQTAATF